MSKEAGSATPSQCVYVFTAENGQQQKYKLVVKGDLTQLGTRKIKRYMERATKVPATAQRLFFRHREMDEEWNGDQIGLFDGAQLFMEVTAPPTRHSRSRGSGGEREASRSGVGGRDASHSSRSAGRPVERRATSRRLTFTDEPLGQAAAPQAHSRPRPDANAVGGDVLGERERSRSSVSPTETGTAARQSRSGSGVPSNPPMGGHRQQSGDNAHHAALLFRRSGRVSTSTSSRPSTASGSQYDSRLIILEAENDAVQRENALLREKLLEAERRAANAPSDRQLQEQIDELQDALLEKEAETEEAVKEAEERARVKEEELVRELDKLREERRRIRREQAAAEEEQRATADALRAQLRAQKAELSERDELIQQLRASLAGCPSPRGRSHPLSSSSPERRHGSPKGGGRSLDAMVQASLDHLALVFNACELELDGNNTCVIRVDTDDLLSSETLALLVTLDDATERLYLYATLLNELPGEPSLRLRLYERLLEGSLLGKDMAGAGVGISKESGLVLMSTSVDVRRSDPSALAATARPFVAAVKEWIHEVESILTPSAAVGRTS